VYVVFLSNSTSVKLKLSNGSDVLSLLVSPHSAECPEPTPALTHKTPLSFEPRHANHFWRAYVVRQHLQYRYITTSNAVYRGIGS
jgi:hypothetical protein